MYVVSAQGIQVDESKIQIIKEWSVPSSIIQVRSCHGVTSFYRRFVKKFSSLVLKAKRFKWSEKAQASFEEIKSKLINAPSLALLSFCKVFED